MTPIISYTKEHPISNLHLHYTNLYGIITINNKDKVMLDQFVEDIEDWKDPVFGTSFINDLKMLGEIP
jgi:hypothetical protein